MTILLIRQVSPDPRPAQLAGHAVQCEACATLSARRLQCAAGSA